MHSLIRVGLLGLLTTTAGCQLWLGGDDDCQYGGATDEAPGLYSPFAGYRDPWSGLCIEQGGGGGGTPCNPIPVDDADQAPPFEDYALCDAGCEGLDELTCVTTPACRAAYTTDCFGCDGGFDERFYLYYQCWGTAPSGPVQGGDCTAFDALECSRHDDCAALHDVAAYAAGADADEAEAIAAPEIGPFLQCVPERSPIAWPPACEIYTSEESCIAADCTPVYQGEDCTCPDGTDPGFDPNASGCTCQNWLYQLCTSPVQRD